MLWFKKKKNFMCRECGQLHSGWPALGFSSPSYYHGLTLEEKELAEINDDFCVIRNDSDTYYFIRTVLIQHVTDSDESLQYGLWVSLSEKSFNDYRDNYTNHDHKAVYFGWLNSCLSEYDHSISIPLDVVAQPGNHRPEISPHRDTDHPFVTDYYNGITSHEAQRRVDEMLNSIN